GFTNPILVDTNDGIIAGHGRLLAARELGLEKVPVVVLDHLTDAQRRAYIIGDNRLAEDAGWDNALLAEALDALLNDDGFDIDVIGFTADELDDLLGSTEGDDSAELPGRFKEYGDEIATDYRCPSCGYEWSGKPR